MRICAGLLLMLKGLQLFGVLVVLVCSMCSTVLVCAHSGRGPSGCTAPGSEFHTEEAARNLWAATEN